MHIRAGDTVEVIRGEQRGERGQVQRVMKGHRSGNEAGQYDANGDRVVVAGVNLIIKHQRRTGNVRTQTGRIEREAPIHISNVLLVCPHCGKATRVGYHMAVDGTKSRQCRKCDSLID